MNKKKDKYLSKVFGIFDVAEDASRESVEDVEAVKTITTRNENVEIDEGCRVGPGNTQRWVETGNKI